MCYNSFLHADPLTSSFRGETRSVMIVRITPSVAAPLTRSSWKMWISQHTLRAREGKMCTADSDLSNVQSCFAKKKAHIMVIGNHGCCFEEKWMHYVILITHQSDIKICTTNFFSGLLACLLASHTIRIPIAARCVCATRRSLITFPFFLHFSKPAKLF